MSRRVDIFRVARTIPSLPISPRSILDAIGWNLHLASAGSHSRIEYLA